MARTRNYDRVNAFIARAKEIANDDSHGYSQYHRWGPDYDCSSMMYECAYSAGYPVSREDPRYTGAMIEDFTAAGYKCYDFDGNLYDLDPGDILLNTSCHTAVYIGDGLIAEASIDEYGGIAGNNYGDQTGEEIHIRSVYNYPWTHVLEPPADYDETPDPEPAPAPSGKNPLYGIDVSSWQPAEICSMVDIDFAIVKMSGNPQAYDWDYVNPKAKQQADEAYAKTGCVGLYHFTWGKDPAVEADYFVDRVSELGYLGKAMLVIDYEGDALDCGREWVRAFAERVESRAGYKPVIYSSGSVVVGQGLFGLGYPIWVANYYRGYESIWGYDTSGCYIYGGCENALIWQFTSSGYLSGYDGALDLNVFYGTASDWASYTGNGETPSPAPTPDTGDAVVYRASTDPAGRSWLDEMRNGYDTGGSRDDFAGELGEPMRWIAVKNATYRVYSQANGWLPWVSQYNTGDLENGCAGDGSPILGIEVKDNNVRYAAHIIGGGWYSELIGQHDTGGSGDTYAGDMYNTIDAVRMRRA